MKKILLTPLGLLCVLRAKAVSLLGGLVTVAVIILVVAGIIHVAIKIIDKLDKVFATKASLVYTYQDYERNWFFTPEGDLSVDQNMYASVNPGEYDAEDGMGAGSSPVEEIASGGHVDVATYQIYWRETLKEEWIPFFKFTCPHSDIKGVMLHLSKWDHEQQVETRKKKKSKSPVRVRDSGFYLYELIAD